MKTKEKIFLYVMLLMFLATVGLFYYQNFYKPMEVEKNKVSVLVAQRDIPEGTELREDNVKWLKLDKDMVLPSYITKANEADLSKMRVDSKIMEGDIINIHRLTDKDAPVNENNQYTIEVIPDISTKIEKGDLVRVYVQIINDKDKSVTNRLVYGKKEVLDITPRGEGLTSLSAYDYIKIEASDLEAISYYNAKQLGKVIVLKYKEDMDAPDYELPYIDVIEDEALLNIIEKQESKSYDSVEDLIGPSDISEDFPEVEDSYIDELPETVLEDLVD